MSSDLTLSTHRPGGGRRRRIALAVAVAGTCLAVTAACSGSGASGSKTSGQSARAQTLITAENTPPASFDPVQADNSTVDTVTLPLYDAMVTFDDNGEVIPKLATKWKVSEDGKSIDVTLRDGTTFHDGAAVTATDVQYTLDRIKKINIGVSSFLTNYASTVVTDPTHLTIKLTQPDAPFLAALTRVYIVNSKLVTKNAGADDGQKWLATNDAGSGPYQLASYSPNQEAKFSRYEKYWGGFDGQAKNAIVKYMNAATQGSALLDQSVDVAVNIDANDWASFESNNSFTVDKANTNLMLYVFFKMSDAATSNKALREAIAYAYNYPQHQADILKGAGQIAKGVLPSGMQCYDGSVEQPTYDPAKAKSLLAESGLSNASLTLTYLSTEAEMVKAATLLQADLKAIGVTLTLKAITYPQFVEVTKSNSTTPDLGMIYAFPPFPDASSIMGQVFNSKYINGGQNWGGYRNGAVDKAVNEAQQLTGKDQRCSLYNQAEKLVVADTPTINMSNPQFVTVYNKRLQGYKYLPAHNYVVDFYRIKIS